MILDALIRRYEQLGSPADAGLGFPKDVAITELFSRPFVLLHFIAEIYTARTTLRLALDLGWEDLLRRGATVDELLEGLHPTSRNPAEWMMAFLAEKGLLMKEGDAFRLEGPVDLDLDELRASAEREAPGQLHNLDLLDAVRSHVRPYFFEGRSGESCLFDLAVFPLWLDYFRNENILYRSNNLFALAALREGLKPGSRILELGGGAGSFAQGLALDGAQKGYLDRIADYHFTDVAPTFLRRAQRGLKELAPGLPLSFGSLDINRPLDAQGLEGITFDAIVGINVLHVARDLPATLRDLRRHLVPGGQLVLGECLKPHLDHPIYIEFFFQFMASFTEVITDPELRPRHGFLTPEAWVRVLEAAGFRHIRQVPPARPLMERYPEFYVGAFAAEA